MHKKMLLWVTMIVFSQMAMADSTPFTGFYGNMNFGWMYADDSIQQQTRAVLSVFDPPLVIMDSASPDVRNNSITGGLGLGFAQGFKDSIIVGLEARANIESLLANFHHTSSDTLNQTTMTTNTSIKLENDFSFLVKLGILLPPHGMIYGLVGPTWGNFNLNSNAEFSSAQGLPVLGNVYANESQYETGWLVGLGMEYLIMNHVSVGLEYTYADYGDLDFHDPVSAPLRVFGFSIPGSSVSLSDKTDAKNNNVVIKLNYYIG